MFYESGTYDSSLSFQLYVTDVLNSLRLSSPGEHVTERLIRPIHMFIKAKSGTIYNMECLSSVLEFIFTVTQKVSI